MVVSDKVKDMYTEEVFQPHSAAFRADPYPTYAALRQLPGLYYYAPWDMYLASRHADIRQIASSEQFVRQAPEALRSKLTLQGSPAETRPNMPYFERYVASNLLEKDGRTHRRLRQAVFTDLKLKNIESLEGRIRDIASKRLSSLAHQGVMDLLSDFAVPVSVAVIAELLGVPVQDQDSLRMYADQITKAYEPETEEGALVDAEAAAKSFSELMTEHVVARRKAPKDDLISRLAAKVGPNQDEDQISLDECITMCIFLLNAGHEATVNALGNGVWALINHPDQFAALSEGQVTVSAAVEEMLRFDAPLQLFHRFAGHDTEISGTHLCAGDKVGLLYGSANRDEMVFKDPNSFDITRGAADHMAFGIGEHLCLGMHLARLDLRVMLEVLLEHTDFLVSPDTTADYRDSIVFRGLKELPLEC